MRALVKAGAPKGYTVKYEWEDKAGGYAIQGYAGKHFVKEIRGDYYNVVGLPLNLVKRMLRDIGYDIK